MAQKSPSAHHRTNLSAVSSQIRHATTIGKKLVKQQYLLHMSSQYGELQPMIFAVFDPSPLTVCINCSFFTYIYLLFYCQIFVRSVVILYILKTNTRHQAHKPVKKCNYLCPIFETEWSREPKCVSVPNRCRDMAIF